MSEGESKADKNVGKGKPSKGTSAARMVRAVPRRHLPRHHARAPTLQR